MRGSDNGGSTRIKLRARAKEPQWAVFKHYKHHSYLRFPLLVDIQQCDLMRSPPKDYVCHRAEDIQLHNRKQSPCAPIQTTPVNHGLWFGFRRQKSMRTYRYHVKSPNNDRAASTSREEVTNHGPSAVPQPFDGNHRSLFGFQSTNNIPALQRPYDDLTIITFM